MIALNAILSRREGVDYLFSRGNQKALRETVNNLWQSCLWHSIDPKWLQPAYENCMEKIQDVEQGRTTYGDEDNQGLIEISNVLRRALDDKLFLSMMSTHSPSYLIHGLPDIPKKKWSWLGGHPGVYVDNDGTQSHSLVGGDNVVDITSEIAHSKKNTSALWVYDDSKDTLDTMAVHSRKRKIELAASASENGEEQPKQLAFVGAADLESAILYSTTSSKLNYLVNQIKRYHQTEKCIIFSQHWNEIQEIFTALRLVKVRALMYLDSKMVSSVPDDAYTDYVFNVFLHRAMPKGHKPFSHLTPPIRPMLSSCLFRSQHMASTCRLHLEYILSVLFGKQLWNNRPSKELTELAKQNRYTLRPL